MSMLKLRYVVFEFPNQLESFENARDAVSYIRKEYYYCKDVEVGLEFIPVDFKWFPKPFPFAVIHLIKTVKRATMLIRRGSILENLKNDQRIINIGTLMLDKLNYNVYVDKSIESLYMLEHPRDSIRQETIRRRLITLKRTMREVLDSSIKRNSFIPVKDLLGRSIKQAHKSHYVQTIPNLRLNGVSEELDYIVKARNKTYAIEVTRISDVKKYFDFDLSRDSFVIEIIKKIMAIVIAKTFSGLPLTNVYFVYVCNVCEQQSPKLIREYLRLDDFLESLIEFREGDSYIRRIAEFIRTLINSAELEVKIVLCEHVDEKLYS